MFAWSGHDVGWAVCPCNCSLAQTQEIISTVAAVVMCATISLPGPQPPSFRYVAGGSLVRRSECASYWLQDINEEMARPHEGANVGAGDRGEAGEPVDTPFGASVRCCSTQKTIYCDPAFGNALCTYRKPSLAMRENRGPMSSLATIMTLWICTLENGVVEVSPSAVQTW